MMCPVCLDLYNDPTQLPCEHVICRECLRALVMWTSHKESISCPVCRNPTSVPNDDITAFPTHPQLSRLVEMYEEKSRLEATTSKLYVR